MLLDAIVNEFSASSLARDADRMAMACGRAQFLGEREFARLRVPGLAGKQRAEAVRALGTGAALADFVTAPVALSTGEQDVVRRLGGLLILAIRLFDTALDQGLEVPRLFEETEVRGEGDLAAVVRDYFAALHALPDRLPALTNMLWRTLQRLYVAELQSVGIAGGVRRVWWRKNALPFVAMGLPAWMLTEEWSERAFRSHLLWLARLGDFFGWLDDAVDRELDGRLGHANRIRDLSEGEAQFAVHLAARGTRVVRDWERSARSTLMKDVFGMVVWTWIENSPSTSP